MFKGARVCDEISDIENGMSNPKHELLIVGEKVTITCRNGYKLMGKSVIECGANGQFPHPLPKCVIQGRRYSC